MVTWQQVVQFHMKNRKATSSEIARALGCVQGYVSKVAKARGLTLRKGRRCLEPWEREAIAGAVAGDEKIEAIAEEFKTTPRTVARIARKRKIAPRRRGWKMPRLSATPQ